MMIEINNVIVNTSNICMAAKFYPQNKTNPEHPNIDYPRIAITFVSGHTYNIAFDNIDQMEVGYQTLKLCETVINNKK